MINKELFKLQEQGEAPSWMTLAGYSSLSKGYRLKGETPKGMYLRVAEAAALSLGKPELASTFFEMMWKNYLCPASPVLANLGTDRGLPISCFGIDVGDSVKHITQGICEMSMMSKHGGGVGVNLNRVRPRNSLIKNGANGRSEGVVPFAKMYDSSILAMNQGSTRRGAASVNLNIEHGDWQEFIRMRRPEGDINRQCGNLHHCTVINDEFMIKVESGDPVARAKWAELMRARMETGESYIMFKDTVNRANPEAYKNNGLEIDMTNICCLTGDTLVVTKNGARKIEDLVNETVEIFDGEKWVKCSNFEKKGSINELYEVELKSGYKIKATYNHRFKVYENYNHIRRNRHIIKTASELLNTDFIELHTQGYHGKEIEHGAYLKGFLLGDGTYNKASNKPILNLHSTKYCCIDNLIKSCLEISINGKLRSDCIVDPLFSEEIDIKSENTYGKQIFKKMKGLTARSNELNFWVTDAKNGIGDIVHTWDRNTKIQFLAGILDADGTLGKSIQITQKNENIIKDIQSIVFSLGYAGSIDKQPNGYRLTIGSYDSFNLLAELCSSRLKWSGKAPNRRTTGYRRIKNITKINVDKTDVYCPNIPTTGFFALANGTMTGNSEITLYTDDDHSFICCLSSLNLARYDEWKDEELNGMSIPYLSILFLNGVLNEFINKAQYIWGMEKSVASAKKGRAVGLGVLGWHTLLQSKMMPFGSFSTMQLNAEIFKYIKDESVKASKDLAKSNGEPEWCLGTGMYNTHLLALAPTRSNSIISGELSASIEPIIANAFVDKSAKGTFIRHNLKLKEVLDKYGKDDHKVWKDIARKHGSVQHLDFLSDAEKEVFKTAYEIHQGDIVAQAAQRQRWVCQAQSLNLFFNTNVDPRFFNEVHLEAWRLGVKTLYYCRSRSVLQADVASRDEGCSSCEG